MGMILFNMMSLCWKEMNRFLQAKTLASAGRVIPLTRFYLSMKSRERLSRAVY